MQIVIEHYRQLTSSLRELPHWAQVEATRRLVRTDLFYLLRYVMNRRDVEQPWLLARIREVQGQPDGHLDLWPRDHRKSTVVTFAKTVQDILASHGDDPLQEWKGLEPTFGIFSHTRPIAKAFLRQIKTELEQNDTLRSLFPDVLYDKPDRESPRWSEDNGLVVRRRSNPKEATVEAWGLVDGQPTGKHFNVLIWDDVVTRESVSNPDMIAKTTDAWAQSTNLGDSQPRKRALGTRWHFNDSYRAILERGALAARIRPATDDGTLTGNPVFLTPEQFAEKVRDQGPYMASAQLLLNPIADSKHTFRREWIKYYEGLPSWENMNRAILVDPASSKKADSDFTAIAVIGKGPDENYYLLDAVRDRLGLRERTERVIALHRKWKPMHTGYEKYGMQADIEYLRELQTRQTYNFDVVELGGALSKQDRINRLIPVAADGKLWLPHKLLKTNHENKLVDVVAALVEEELLAWPVPPHDDLMDAISRVFDLGDFPWPMLDEKPDPDDRYRMRRRTGGTWMSR